MLLLKQLHPKTDLKLHTGTQSPARPSKQISSRKDLYKDGKARTAHELVYHKPNAIQRLVTTWRVAVFPPWLRIQYGSVLEVKVCGVLSETFGSSINSEPSLPQLCTALHNAAYDPRVIGVIIKPASIKGMWAALQELRRHIDLVRSSGKTVWAYVERGGMKEYYLAAACKRIFVPPSAQLTLAGFSTAATYYRGILSKLGVQPEVVRCGKYKAAADQFMADELSDANREQLTALMEETQDVWLQAVASSRGKSVDEVRCMLDAAHHDMEALQKGGWLDGLLYETQVMDRLKRLTGSRSDVPLVSVHHYSRQPCFVPQLRGGPTIAIIRAEGMIMGKGGVMGIKCLNVGQLISQVRTAKQQRNIKAVVLRIDSPGGDALASDIMWREVHELALVKPVIASMGNVAGSGGYMIAMAANAIVAEQLSIAGSIGVVSGKFSLRKLYEMTGYKKEVLTAGKYAGLLADHKPFSEEQYMKFKEAADHTYAAFRAKAAMSRNMSVSDMEAVAQGRVWSGAEAVKVGLADAVGGVNRALLLAKEAAGIPSMRPVSIKELSMSPLAYAVQMVRSFKLALGQQALGSVWHGVEAILPNAKAVAHEAAFLTGLANTEGQCLTMMPGSMLGHVMGE